MRLVLADSTEVELATAKARGDSIIGEEIGVRPEGGGGRRAFALDDVRELRIRKKDRFAEGMIFAAIGGAAVAAIWVWEAGWTDWGS